MSAADSTVGEGDGDGDGVGDDLGPPQPTTRIASIIKPEIDVNIRGLVITTYLLVRFNLDEVSDYSSFNSA